VCSYSLDQIKNGFIRLLTNNTIVSLEQPLFDLGNANARGKLIKQVCSLLKDALSMVSDFVRAKGLIKGCLANGFCTDEDEKKRYHDAENLIGHHHLSEHQQSERDWFNRFNRRINLLLEQLKKLECKSPKKKRKMMEYSISAESVE
jgi:hypothetical protein